MGQIAPMQERMNDVGALLERQKKAFARGLPQFMARQADQFVRTALTTIRRNPRIAECSADSLLGALQTAAQLGMMPDGILGHAYLVPRRNRGAWECNLQLGYQGLLQLAYRSGDIKAVHLDVVYAGDTFERMGHHRIRKHVPTDGERGEILYAYAIVETQGGGEISWCVDAADIKKARQSSQTDKVWTAHPEAMWMKTALRRVLKYAPCSTDLQRAVSLDERAEAGIAQDMAEVVRAADYSVAGDEGGSLADLPPAEAPPAHEGGPAPAVDSMIEGRLLAIEGACADHDLGSQADAIIRAITGKAPEELNLPDANAVLERVKSSKGEELRALLKPAKN